MKILVGSSNPVKLAASAEAFAAYFGAVEAVPLEVASGVPAQPVGDEVYAGAENRARALMRLNTEQDLGAVYAVGLEGGIVQQYGRWFSFGSVCVVDVQGRAGFGASPHFELPDSVAAELLAGRELGDVVDRLSGLHNTKQSAGAIGYLSGGRIDRKTLYVSGVMMALVPFVTAALFFGENQQRRAGEG